MAEGWAVACRIPCEREEAALCCFLPEITKTTSIHPPIPLCYPAAPLPTHPIFSRHRLNHPHLPQVHRLLIVRPEHPCFRSISPPRFLRPSVSITSLTVAPLSLKPLWLHYSLTNMPTPTTPQCSLALFLPPFMPPSTTQPVPTFSRSCLTNTFHLQPLCWLIGCILSSSIFSTLPDSLTLKSAEYMTRLRCLRGTRSQ